MHKARLTTDSCVTWYCPGCEGYHGVPTEGVIAWTWNGSLERPTLTPSILVYPHDATARCHCFVVEGKIQFLDDCTHALAGKTVDMESEE